jgi:hypothetical protein
MGAPGMATRDTLGTQPDAFNNSPFADSFDRILRTGGSVPAIRSQVGRNRNLIKANGKYKELFEHQSFVYLHKGKAIIGILADKFCRNTDASSGQHEICIDRSVQRFSLIGS